MNYIRRQGGELLLRKEVTSIITENGRVVGVSYRDSKKNGTAEIQVYASQIIANAAIPHGKAMIKSLSAKERRSS